MPLGPAAVCVISLPREFAHYLGRMSKPSLSRCRTQLLSRHECMRAPSLNVQEAEAMGPAYGANRENADLLREVILLAACGANEVLPQTPDLPADVFTACLTTPIKACSSSVGQPSLHWLICRASHIITIMSWKSFHWRHRWCCTHASPVRKCQEIPPACNMAEAEWRLGSCLADGCHKVTTGFS
jgi:hypothetical protein